MSTPDYTTKVCTSCKKELPATSEYFHIENRVKSGLRAICIECRLEQKRRYRKEHITEARQRDRLRDKSRNQKEYKQRWYEEHKQEHSERSKRYREENPDKVREYQRRYWEENPDKAREYHHKRRVRKCNAEGTHTAADIRLQITAQTDKRGRLRCWWCGKVIKGGYHVDHVIPLARGGSNGAENICIAHPKCNLSKHTKTPHEMGKLF